MSTATESHSTVLGAFEDRREAEFAVGELRQAGFHEDKIRVGEVRYYRGDSEAVRTSVTVDANGRTDEAVTILRRHGDADVHADTLGVTATVLPMGEGATIQLHEEELLPHKQMVETGEVRIRKEVVTEHKTIEVPVWREEIFIERYPPTGALDSAPDIKPGEEIRIPVRVERVTVEKRPVVREEVRVGRRVVQETERVGGDVRKEEVRVERIEREVVLVQEGHLTASGAMTPGEEEAQIRERAYLKWLEEGRPTGQDRRHYFEAAKEV